MGTRLSSCVIKYFTHERNFTTESKNYILLESIQIKAQHTKSF